MKKVSACIIGVGSVIFLLAQQALAAASDPGQVQALYGVQVMQYAYGPGPYLYQNMTLFEKAIFILKTPLVWVVLVPIIFIIGLVIFIVKKRKSKKKLDVQKNSQSRRA